MKKIVLLSLLLFTLSCEKDFTPDRRFIGSWKILSPVNDTIIFKNESNFTKKFYDGINHTFDYSYDNDSITIQYKGPHMILVLPTTHFYELKNNELTIDFSNGCYGFEREIYNLTKIE